jgi:hypothetical protein
MQKMSQNAESLCAGYPAALKNPDKMRGWKRSFTLYKRSQATLTGRPEFRFHAGIKMKLTKMGLDTSPLS